MLRLLLLALILGSLSSCRVFYPNVMFKTPDDYDYATLDTVPPPQYTIKPGDRLSFQATTNLGLNQMQSLVPTFEGGGAGQQRQSGNFDYLVKEDGTVKLPILGNLALIGMTVPQAEQFIEDSLGYFYKKPLVTLNVTNRRVYVYTGGSEAAKVVVLEDENLSLIEVLTMAGGVRPDGKAYKVKVIRGGLDEPIVALYDLSTMESAQQADVIIQPNDIVYVEPTTRAASGLLKEISPILGIIGSITSLISLALIFSRTNGN